MQALCRGCCPDSLLSVLRQKPFGRGRKTTSSFLHCLLARSSDIAEIYPVHSYAINSDAISPPAQPSPLRRERVIEKSCTFATGDTKSPFRLFSLSRVHARSLPIAPTGTSRRRSPPQ